MREEFKPVEPVPIHALTDACEETDGVLAQDHDAEFGELAACIEAGVARSKRRVTSFRRIFTGISAASVIATLLVVFAPLFLMNFHRPHIREGTAILLGAGACYVEMIVILIRRVWLRIDHRSEQERTAARKLAKMDDVRAVAPMIDTIEWITQWIGDRTLRSEFWQELGRLMLRMNEDEARAIGNDRLGILAVWIQGWDLPLVQKPFDDSGNEPLIGMLHVMGHVGQSVIQIGRAPTVKSVSLLPVLETWIRGAGSGKDPAVQLAAVGCREAIRQKMALARSGEQLLRASGPFSSGRETMLRPAQGGPQTNPQELLRPDESE